jgi:hypothetical protein
MSLLRLHVWPPLLVLTLAGDVLCLALAVFGDATRRYHMPHIFWWILWLSQIPLGVELLTGMALLGTGAHLPTPYHMMYGAFIIATLLALFGLRPGGALRRAVVRNEEAYRESRWLILLCLFLAGLAGRAYQTGILGR